MPPHIPYSSSFSIANSKHSCMTGQIAQMALARRTSIDVREGRCRCRPSYSLPKKSSELIPLHFASFIQGASGIQLKGSSESLCPFDNTSAVDGDTGSVHEILISVDHVTENGVSRRKPCG